jgi:hypothetical protein
MSDEQVTTLPARLRSDFLWRDVELKKLAYEAADEIERLQKELEATEDALIAESDNNAVLANS